MSLLDSNPTQPLPPRTVSLHAIAPDCRHYRGDRPCRHNRLCNGCEQYDPIAQRICIIKLGALGDVIRTLCILPALRRLYPTAHITWVSQPAGCRMIGQHPLIDRVLTFDALTAMQLSHERFTVVINLDKEPQPCALAMSLRCERRLGVALSDWGTPIPANDEAHDYFHLGLSDELKFHQNTRSYPELVHAALGLPYQGDAYVLPVRELARQRAMQTLARAGWKRGRTTLGINVGAGNVFANKMWPVVRIVALMRQLFQEITDLQVVLLGGPAERPIIERILGQFHGDPNRRHVVNAGTEHEETDFVALVDCCDAVFSGDTMAMHVAIARQKPVVVVFGPTCAQEIELYGRGVRLEARVPCAPCYKRRCDHQDACLDAVTIADAAAAIRQVLPGQQTQEVRHSLPVLPQRRAG
jgi:heptosyltransferase-2